MVNIQNSTNTAEFQEWTRIKKTEGSKAAHQYYLRSAHWKQARATILARDGHTCKLCGIHESKTKEKYLHVHHQTYASVWNEKEQDLISLCHSCHTEIHKAGGTLWVSKYKKTCVKRNTTFTPKARQARITHIQNAAHRKKKRKNKKHRKGNSTTLWAPIWAGKKRWHKRLKYIQKQIDEKRTVSVKQTTRRRPAEQ